MTVPRGHGMTGNTGPATAAAAAAGTQRAKQETLAALLRQLADAVMHLLRSEARLARAEIGAGARHGARGLGLILGGLLCATLALVGVLGALIMLLSSWLGIVGATLVVAGILAVLAAVLVASGIAAVRQTNLAPKRALANIRRDLKTLQGD